jgi:dipeptidyl-peptidase-3
MRTLEREAPGLLSIVENENNELEIKLDSSKIGTIGRGIVDYYLLRLHVFRCSANEAGIKLFDEMTHVDERFRKYRELVLQHRPPAKQIILPRTVREGDEIVLKEYDSTKEGMIQSWVETCI